MVQMANLEVRTQGEIQLQPDHLGLMLLSRAGMLCHQKYNIGDTNVNAHTVP